MGCTSLSLESLTPGLFQSYPMKRRDRSPKPSPETSHGSVHYPGSTFRPEEQMPRLVLITEPERFSGEDWYNLALTLSGFSPSHKS